jgi:hypothetical protein
MSVPQWARRLVPYALIPLIAGLGYANYRFGQGVPGGSSFLPAWTAVRAWVLEGTDPYSLEASFASQEAAYGRPADPGRGDDPLHYTSVLSAATLHLPFSLLPYAVARAAWMTLLELGLLATVVLGLQLADWRPSPRLQLALFLLPIVWFPGVALVIDGDAAVIEGLLIVGALLAVRRRSDVLAGVLLALSTAYLGAVALLLPLVLAWAVSVRRWRLPVSFLVSMAGLIGFSLVLFDGWPVEWLRRVVAMWQATTPSSAVLVIGELTGTSSALARLGVVALLVGVAMRESVLVLGRDMRGLPWLANYALVTTVLSLPQRDSAGLVLLVPAILLVFSNWSGRRGGEAGILVTVLLMAVGSWVPYLVTLGGGAESDALLVGVPVLTWIGLWWIRWWATRPPLPSLEAT